MAKFEKKAKAGLPDWMGTYGDLVTLLLCFFIMLFATAEVDTSKFDILLQAFNPSVFENTGGDNIIGNLDSDENKELSSILSDEIVYQSELQKLEQDLNNFITKEGLEDSIDVIKEADKITMRLSSSLLFNSGKADLKNDVKPHLKTISKTLPKDFDVQIEGHTDNLPISNAHFASNWELSVLRGVNVLKYLSETCGVEPSKLSAAGYGEFRPVADNATESGRSKNRRVDIILFKNNPTQENKK